LLKEIGIDTESLVQKIREINSSETTPKKKMIFNKSEVKKIMAAVHHRGHNKG
jgi:hypothetical protein